MIYCILAKMLATAVAALLSIRYELNIHVQAFLIGIVPIWSEVLISKLTKIEPARETKKSLLVLDAATDTLSFLIVPSSWYFLVFRPELLPVGIALALFITAGIFRIRRFVREGLDSQGNFLGLPVTYTGYIWIGLASLSSDAAPVISTAALVCLSYFMVSKKIKIKASQ